MLVAKQMMLVAEQMRSAGCSTLLPPNTDSRGSAMSGNKFNDIKGAGSILSSVSGPSATPPHSIDAPNDTADRLLSKKKGEQQLSAAIFKRNLLQKSHT